MHPVRQRSARHVAALFLVALLSLPLILGGHHHQPGGLGASRSGCAICAVTAHVPVLSPPAPPALDLPLLARLVPPPSTVPAPRIALRTRAPRAPPASGCTIVA